MSEAPPPPRSRRALAAVAAALIALGAATLIQTRRAGAPTPIAAPPPPARIDVTIDLVAAAPDADVAAITARAEAEVRAAFAQAATGEPLAKLPVEGALAVARLAATCAAPDLPGVACDPTAIGASLGDPARSPALGALTVSVTPVDAIGDYRRAEKAAQRLAWPSAAGRGDRDAIAQARILVLLGRWYDEAEMDAAITGGRPDDAASRRHGALARYTAAARITTEILARRSEDLEDALRDPPRLDAWLRAHAGAEADAALLLWAGAAWSGKSRTAEGEEAADAHAVAEKLLATARAIGQGATWELATAELGTLRARSTPPRLDAAKALFEEAVRKAPHGSPLVRVAYAMEVACRKGDGALHGALLGEATAWSDPDPRRRWEIATAAEVARRAGTQERWKRCRGGT